MSYNLHASHTYSSHPSFFISEKVEVEWTSPNSSGAERTLIVMSKIEKKEMFHVGIDF